MERKEKALNSLVKSTLVVSRGISIASLALVLTNSALSATGVFITKSDPWSPANEVDETKFFTDIEDHNGYFIVALQDGETEQVNKALLTALIYQPVIPASIQNDATLADLTKEKSRLQEESTSHPTARLIIGQWISALSQAIASYKNQTVRPDTIPTSNGVPSTEPPTTQTKAQASEELITADGKHYQNFTVSSVEPDGLVIVTDSGVEKIPFTNLSEATQNKYGYDPAKAAQFAAAEQAAATQRAAYESQETAVQNQQAANAEVSQTLDKAAVVVSGKVLSVADGGVLLTDAVFKIPAMHNVVSYTNPLDGSVMTTPRAGFDTVASDEPVFIHGVKGLVDGDAYTETTVYPVPSYSYDSAGGAAKTVRAFAPSKDEAIQLLQNSSQ